jgi:hypothetical protein
MFLSKRANLWLSDFCFIMGFISILASILTWVLTGGDGSPEALAKAWRWGVFVGLWVPSFFALSVRFRQYAGDKE